MAQVIPFPLAARRAFVMRQADVVLSMKPESGERHIVRAVDQQREIMARKGVAPDIINRECASLEAAIRTALWRAVLTPGGAA